MNEKGGGGGSSVKISGYLEKKRNTMKMVSSWKLKWFVLEDRLLLYYRSKDEYDALSPCKGSINLCPTCKVKPLLGTSGVFQIETRARTIVLRAKTRSDQEKWLQAILSVLNQNNPNKSPKGITHFRYSSDDLIQSKQNRIKELSRQNTLPGRRKLSKRRTFCGSLENVLKPDKTDMKNRKFSSSRDVTASEELITNDLYEKTIRPKKENFYCRISSDSSDSKENDNKPEENFYNKINPDYVTQTEMDQIENDADVVVENEAYCTTGINIIETEDAKYHEYNLPQKDNVYSIPNVDQNENRIAKYEEIDPYSICDIYPKEKEETSEEAIYDTPLEVLSEVAGKGKGEETKIEEEEKKPQLPKKMSFLKKIFKLKIRKRSTEDDDSKGMKEDGKEKVQAGDLISRKALEELQRLLMEKKELLQGKQTKNGPDIVNKKVIEELKRLLNSKKDRLKTDEEAVYQEIAEISNLCDNRLSETPKESSSRVENSNTNSLIRIDRILNDLDNMKKTSKPFTNSKVKTIIAKFNSLEIGQIKEDDNEEVVEEVVLRDKSKNEGETLIPDLNPDDSKTSIDELSQLLAELAKVTSAPVLTPGITTSLGANPIEREEEFKIVENRQRRHSDPDYDVPRPHANLAVSRAEPDSDDGFVATRFFGPPLSNYEYVKSSPPTSMTPDSLEVPSEIGSYHSHGYGKIKQKPYFLHKQREGKSESEKEAFADSLESSTAL